MKEPIEKGKVHIARPEELPFYVPEALEMAINEYIDAYERDLPALGIYADSIHQAMRLLDEHHERMVYDYYVCGGWAAGADIFGQ